MVVHDARERGVSRDGPPGEAAASRCFDPWRTFKRFPLLYEASLFAAGMTAVYAAFKSIKQRAVLPRLAWRALAGITGIEFAGMLIARPRRQGSEEPDEDKVS